jgi:hypothetical protein
MSDMLSKKEAERMLIDAQVNNGNLNKPSAKGLAIDCLISVLKSHEEKINKLTKYYQNLGMAKERFYLVGSSAFNNLEHAEEYRDEFMPDENIIKVIKEQKEDVGDVK